MVRAAPKAEKTELHLDRHQSVSIDIYLQNCAPTIVGRDQSPPFIHSFTPEQIHSLLHWMSYRLRKALAHRIGFYTASAYMLMSSFFLHCLPATILHCICVHTLQVQQE